MDDHLLNATYYSPELEEPLESTAMLGNIVHSDSPNHIETAASVGKSTLTLHTVRVESQYRPVVPGCAGCAMAHPDFVRSVT